MPHKEYKQNPTAIALSYLPVKWIAGMFIFPVVSDYLNYRNTKLIFEDDFLIFQTGTFTIGSKEIPYEDIKSVRTIRPLFGQFFDYGDILIRMKDELDTIIFKNVANPEIVRKAIQDRFVKSQKVKLV